MDQPKKDLENPELIEPAEAEQPELSEQEKLQEDLAQKSDRLLRLAAEFDNFKKISLRERAQSVKFANEALISSLLPVIDNLEQAIKAGQKNTAASTEDLLVGLEMVLKQMIDTLSKFGVEFFDSKGQLFDPNRHEALCEQEVDGVEEGSVVEEYQKGCLLNGRLLRAARVAVAKKSSI